MIPQIVLDASAWDVLISAIVPALTALFSATNFPRQVKATINTLFCVGLVSLRAALDGSLSLEHTAWAIVFVFVLSEVVYSRWKEDYNKLLEIGPITTETFAMVDKISDLFLVASKKGETRGPIPDSAEGTGPEQVGGAVRKDA